MMKRMVFFLVFLLSVTVHTVAGIATDKGNTPSDHPSAPLSLPAPAGTSHSHWSDIMVGLPSSAAVPTLTHQSQGLSIQRLQQRNNEYRFFCKHYSMAVEYKLLMAVYVRNLFFSQRFQNGYSIYSRCQLRC